jgi:aspartyl-tRNA(Asn)/glutamyl-tRNA(Gln) amidotransferase subunit C
LKITEQEVRNVADLANLKLTAEEVARMARDMDAMLTHVEELNELDTTGVEPMAQVLYAGGDSLRDDVEGPTLPNEDVTANAAMSGAGFFKVPRVIER